MREKLIELVGRVQDCGCDVTEVVKMNYVENNVLVDYLLANGVTIQKWIPVTERLPEDRTNILCYVNSVPKGYRQIAWFTKCLEDFCNVDFEGDRRNGFVNYDSEVGYYRLHGVTHWMPLPQPPKEDAE